jgi:gamma-glutamylputrescine oxidase
LSINRAEMQKTKASQVKWYGTWYEATALPEPQTHDLSAISADYDVAVMGAGLAGLSAALHLAELGAKTIVIDTSSIGEGASGRNGGFCSGGWAAPEDKILKAVGPLHAQTLEHLANEGREAMRARAFSPPYQAATPVAGILNLTLSAKTEHELGAKELKRFIKGPRYRGGYIDPVGFHFHPLNFMRLLAQDCMDAGVTIIERHEASCNLSPKAGFVNITLNDGQARLRALNTVWATGGYGGNGVPDLARILLPIQTFIAVTSPMEAILDQHIPTYLAVGDDRRAGNYFRRLPDGRLLWGMGISALGELYSGKIARKAQLDIKSHMPHMAAQMQTAGVGIDFAWSGNMAYARHFLPYVGKLGARSFALAGFGGHGMNTAFVAGRVLAQHLCGLPSEIAAFDAIARKPVFGNWGLMAAESHYQLSRWKDRLAEFSLGRG